MQLALTPEEAAFRDELRTFYRTKIPEEIRERTRLGAEVSRAGSLGAMNLAIDAINEAAVNEDNRLNLAGDDPKAWFYARGTSTDCRAYDFGLKGREPRCEVSHRITVD